MIIILYSYLFVVVCSMFDYHWSALWNYRDSLWGFGDKFYFSDVRRVANDGSILIPQKMREKISIDKGLLEVLCFVEKDSLLHYENCITCVHPDNTHLVRHLAQENPDKWFLATIDTNYRLHIPIDTLKTIRITKEALLSTWNGISWIVMDPKEELLSYQTYVDALNRWIVSVPEELLNAHPNKQVSP